jgi:hypothetical protein
MIKRLETGYTHADVRAGQKWYGWAAGDCKSPLRDVEDAVPYGEGCAVLRPVGATVPGRPCDCLQLDRRAPGDGRPYSD